ncbi:30S ribosomal protein S4e [Candidatus Woesearchaeota archaeon]|nr:30S ribosomal protein S4e [Candidatus Woesearchaeota archaeon]
MAKSHLKSIAAPGSWRVKRKGFKFITRPRPSGHSLDMCLPLNVVMRDMLDYANTTKEVKYILNNEEVLVDGTRRKDPKLAIGFMDVLTFSKLKESYRVLIDEKGFLKLIKISGTETTLKPAKILGKKILKGGKTQLNLSFGLNILVKKDEYKCGDTLVLQMPNLETKHYYRLEKNSYIFLTSGGHVGDHGVVESIDEKFIIYKSHKGDTFTTRREFAIVIGDKKPVISLIPEVEGG